MIDEIIRIKGCTVSQFAEFLTIVEDADLLSFNDLPAFTSGRLDDYNVLLCTGSKWYARGIESSRSITMSTFIKKYGKPKYSLGGIYERL